MLKSQNTEFHHLSLRRSYKNINRYHATRLHAHIDVVLPQTDIRAGGLCEGGNWPKEGNEKMRK